jgi:hypothetical protein
MLEEENVYYSLATTSFSNNNGQREHTYSIVRDISKEEFEKCSKTIDKLNKEALNDYLYDIVELNYTDLIEKREKYTVEYFESSDEDFFHKMYINLNRLILNLLSTTRSYLDHTKTRLNREFGEQSTEYIEFDKFSYRFLERFRNYAQHCGLPAGKIYVSSSGDAQNKTVNKITLYLVRDELLKNYDWSPKSVKEGLLNQENHFDILPLIDEKFEALKKIHSKISGRNYSVLNDELNELLILIVEGGKKGGKPVLIKVTGKKEAPVIENLEFPFKQIDKITNFKST